MAFISGISKTHELVKENANSGKKRSDICHKGCAFIYGLLFRTLLYANSFEYCRICGCNEDFRENVYGTVYYRERGGCDYDSDVRDCICTGK